MDNPPAGAAQELRNIITSGQSTWQTDDGTARYGNDLDRVLHHEERHSQQWADKGFGKFLQEYFNDKLTDVGGEHNPFEVNAGANDGGYH